jgi:hypothetical protein
MEDPVGLHRSRGERRPDVDDDDVCRFEAWRYVKQMANACKEQNRTRDKDQGNRDFNRDQHRLHALGSLREGHPRIR